MLSKLFRSFWYPGHPGFNSFYRKNYLNKLSSYEDFNYLTDPLAKEQLTGSYTTTHGFEDPVLTLLSRMKHRQDIELSASSTAYLCYHGSKSNFTDDFLWREVNFFTIKTLSEQSDRMIYGLMYGLIRSGRGKPKVLSAIKKEFNERVLNTLTPYQIFEMIEACCLNKSKDFDAVDYMHAHIMPLFKENFKRCRFLFIESYLIKLVTNLASVDYYEEWVWERIFDIILRKKFGDIDSWEVIYRIFVNLRKADVEKNSGVSFDRVFEHLEGLWGRNPDFKWKYKLDEQRYFTIEEMIDRVKDTPVNLTWEEAEVHIKHQLPSWYWDYDGVERDSVEGEATLNFDSDEENPEAEAMADLLEEYQEISKKSKNLYRKNKRS